MSDPSQGITNYVRGSFRRALSMKKSRSETEGVDAAADEDGTEVEAGTLQDGMGKKFLMFLSAPVASSLVLTAVLLPLATVVCPIIFCISENHYSSSVLVAVTCLDNSPFSFFFC